MREKILNITFRTQAGSNYVNVSCNLTLSSVETMPLGSKTIVTCFFSAVSIIPLE